VAPALDTLRSCLNLPTRAAWLRCLAWLLAAFRPFGPFPFLILQGPPGSGKTFAARILRSLIDPCSAPLTPIPASVRDLLTLARHNWILAFDHISTLSLPLTDALCRLSSGLGATLRETSGPAPEPLQQYIRRPVLLTVTERWSCPADLAERAFVVTLPPLPPASRNTETALLTAFQQAWPAILGALCSAVSTALSRAPKPTCSPDAPPTRSPGPWLPAPPSTAPRRKCNAPSLPRHRPTPWPKLSALSSSSAASGPAPPRSSWSSCNRSFPARLPKVSLSSSKTALALWRAMLTLADTGIELKFRHLHGNRRIIELREEGGGASFPQNAKDAPPFRAPSATHRNRAAYNAANNNSTHPEKMRLQSAPAPGPWPPAPTCYHRSLWKSPPSPGITTIILPIRDGRCSDSLQTEIGKDARRSQWRAFLLLSR